MGERLTLDVDSLAHGGDGVARNNGQVVFIPGALPGERVRVEVQQRRKGFLRARLVEVIAPSPMRRQADCEHEAQGCGGCGLRHVGDAHGLRLKAEAAHQTLERIGGRPWPSPTLHAALLDASRRRLRFRFADGRLGLLARGSHRVVPVPSCLAADPALLGAVRAIEEALTQGTRRIRPPEDVLVECVEGRCYAHWNGRYDRQLFSDFERLVADGHLAGARLGTAPRDRYLGAEWVRHALPGTPPLSLHRRPGSFLQANGPANAHLRRLVLEAIGATGAQRVVDLYAGSGNFTLPLSRIAATVVGVEHEGDGISGLRQSIAADTSGALAGVSAIAHDLSDGLPDEIADGRWDVVLMDPPRSGARNLMEHVAAVAPSTLVYVSCAPACLARDVRELGDAYQVAELHAVDMFPRTPHLELVATLTRERGSSSTS